MSEWLGLARKWQGVCYWHRVNPSQDFPEFPRGSKVASFGKTLDYGCEGGSKGWGKARDTEGKRKHK
jgi:hypothetical protein